MKALPTAAVLRLFEQKGLHFDASSGPEVHRLLRAGIEGSKISLSSQELPEDFEELHQKGISFNACSLSQLERIGTALPQIRIGLRFNPGLGSGHSNRTNVGGPASSFGIWHELKDKAKALVDKFGLDVFRIHTHIGSGADPTIWQKVTTLNLEVVRAIPSVTTLNMGGGYKIARVPEETGTDLLQIGEEVGKTLRTFAEATGRELHLEIEPGTFLVGNAGGLLTRIQDVVHTGEGGYRFLKLDSGMTDILRPAMYGAQHPIDLLPMPATVPERESEHPYCVVGHCCESGDILTPQPGDPEGLKARMLPEAKTGDLAWIGAAGAYCSTMSAKNYNSFPEAAEVLREANGRFTLIRKRQTLDQILANEL